MLQAIKHTIKTLIISKKEIEIIAILLIIFLIEFAMFYALYKLGFLN